MPAACKPKAPKQKGGFELAGPAAAGLLLLAQEVARRRLAKKKPAMRGGAPPEVKFVYVQLETGLKRCELRDGKWECVPGSKAIANSEMSDGNVNPFVGGARRKSRKPKARRGGGEAEEEVERTFLAYQDAVAKKAAEDAMNSTEAAEADAGEDAGEPVMSAPVMSEPVGQDGGKRKTRKPSGKKMVRRGGAGLLEGIEDTFTSMGSEITKGVIEGLDQMGKDHANMLPLAVPVAGGQDGGAKKKKATKAKMAQRGGSSCDHFATEMPVQMPAERMPQPEMFAGSCSASGTFTGGAAGCKKKRTQRGGSIGGMVAGMGMGR